jgi:hypothetical protein
MVSAGLQQLFDFVAFFSVPASSRKFRPPATNQKVGSSSLSGRATILPMSQAAHTETKGLPVPWLEAIAAFWG